MNKGIWYAYVRHNLQLSMQAVTKISKWRICFIQCMRHKGNAAVFYDTYRRHQAKINSYFHWRSQLLDLKVEYLIICIICDTDLVNKLILQVYTLHKYK